MTRRLDVYMSSSNKHERSYGSEIPWQVKNSPEAAGDCRL